MFLLFLLSAQERELKELLSHLNVILILFLSLIWMQDIEQKFISSPIQNSDDMAVLHHPDYGPILEHNFDGLIRVSCEMA